MPAIRCHYEVLGVERDVDDSAIKKAHRKLALKCHPDKQIGKSAEEIEAATDFFKLVQEAYECLSDPNERKWYDDHREAILMGIKPGENTNDHAPSYVVEVTMFHHPSAYSNSYSDDEGSFFHVYGEIFSKVDGGERKGWVAQGNIDEPEFRPKFGTSKSEWKEVQSFYRSWESFSSILNFAWVDQYDIREAPNRRYKRAMETENEKVRRKAKKDRNDEILSLLHFVKRRDPRIKQHKLEVEQKKREKEKLKKEDASRRKAEAAIARESWRIEQEKFMANLEASDLDAGRIRLADLEDDEYEYVGKKGKKKRGKKGKKSKEIQIDQRTETPLEYASIESNPNENDNKSCPHLEESSHADMVENDCDQQLHFDEVVEDLEDDYSSEISEEPEIFRCEYCRKDFKSKPQMENHMRSKKHRETVKKFEKRMKEKAKEEEELFELIDQAA